MKTILRTLTLLLMAFAFLVPALSDDRAPANAPIQVIQYIQVDRDLKSTWNYLSDHSRLPQYAKMIESVTLDDSKTTRGSQVGLVRQCNITGMGFTKERVVSYNPPYGQKCCLLTPNKYVLE